MKSINPGRIELVFAACGALFCALALIAELVFRSELNITPGVILGTLFGVLNVRFWKWKLNFFLAAADSLEQGSSNRRTGTGMVLLIPFKMLLLLLGIYLLHRLAPAMVQPFVIGFIAYLLLGSLLTALLVKRLNVSGTFDGEDLR